MVLEPLVYGTLGAATSGAGSSEFILRRSAGLVVPPGDEVALTSAPTPVLADHAETMAVGLRGAETIGQEFGWNGTARRTMNLYRRQ